ncbi:Yqey-like protein-domain-containing protein [Papiliotrema laurentii]|uniref:Altered inheritance of mitochondria protein 41 n=1 Tax=Papiliotrema laurentii TaxID=5418 RepID=A0AAD9CU60_PAPLA|nr:Yqey-like protein-domain-containing protein [Papiliotrema laurentii]
MPSLRLAFAARSSLRASRSLHSSALLRDLEKSALEVRLRDGLKTAMKSKDKASLTCLKSILADITNIAKSGPNPNEHLSESAVMQTLRKGIKDRNTAAESYAPGSPSAHEDNYTNLTNEIKLLQSYLPSAPSAESIGNSISEIIASLDESVKQSKGVQGVVMKALWEKLGESAGGVDRKEIGKLVADALKK